jgi:CBS domain-containing membrane protein
LETVRVKDLMTDDVTTLKRNEKLTLADDLMHLGRVRHLPVLDDDTGEVIGIVTERDLFRGALVKALGYGQRARRKLADTLYVKDVMTTGVITATPDTPIAEAAHMLPHHKIGCLPVVDNGSLVGIITEADFVSWVGRNAG